MATALRTLWKRQSRLPDVSPEMNSARTRLFRFRLSGDDVGIAGMHGSATALA